MTTQITKIKSALNEINVTKLKDIKFVNKEETSVGLRKVETTSKNRDYYINLDKSYDVEILEVRKINK